LREGVSAAESLKVELIAFCEERLSKQKRPRGIDFVAKLPRSAAGKALRAQIRAGYWAGRARQI
ncbi:MAG: AMP-binding enzyme, partial [Gammaproteobacteria bacterium]